MTAPAHEVTLTIPKQWWHTSNHRGAWYIYAPKKRAIRQLATLEARRAGLPTMARAHVTAYIGYPRHNTADPGNASPVVKAALDGLTDAGIWPDDDSKHVIGPDYRRDPDHGQTGVHTVRLVITEQKVMPS